MRFQEVVKYLMLSYTVMSRRFKLLILRFCIKLNINLILLPLQQPTNYRGLYSTKIGYFLK